MLLIALVLLAEYLYNEIEKHGAIRAHIFLEA